MRNTRLSYTMQFTIKRREIRLSYHIRPNNMRVIIALPIYCRNKYLLKKTCFCWVFYKRLKIVSKHFITDGIKKLVPVEHSFTTKR